MVFSHRGTENKRDFWPFSSGYVMSSVPLDGHMSEHEKRPLRMDKFPKTRKIQEALSRAVSVYRGGMTGAGGLFLAQEQGLCWW